MHPELSRIKASLTTSKILKGNWIGYCLKCTEIRIEIYSSMQRFQIAYHGMSQFYKDVLSFVKLFVAPSISCPWGSDDACEQVPCEDEKHKNNVK